VLFNHIVSPSTYYTLGGTIAAIRGDSGGSGNTLRYIFGIMEQPPQPFTHFSHLNIYKIKLPPSPKSLIYKDLEYYTPAFFVVSLVFTRVYVIFLIVLGVHWVG
jgi:hypothetical protein